MLKHDPLRPTFAVGEDVPVQQFVQFLNANTQRGGGFYVVIGVFQDGIALGHGAARFLGAGFRLGGRRINQRGYAGFTWFQSS